MILFIHKIVDIMMSAIVVVCVGGGENKQKNWKYYFHAVVPTTAAHETVDITPIKNGSVWKIGGTPLLARWTSNFDCKNKTGWWYIIKDTPFDISCLKSKRRYEINKGKRNFDVKRINPLEKVDEILSAQVAAYSAWPEKYRPQVNAALFKDNVKSWSENVIYGGFDKKSGELSAYAALTEHENYLEFNVLRAVPEKERLGINAAMVAAIIEDYNDKLGRGFYINDGSRAIRHETAFQDYLEKYFGFRKAYCKLNIVYRFPINVIIKILYPFRRIISKNGKLSSQISAVLAMEEIRRGCR